ncbi:hypothetical protein ACOMHN_067011 [Nucella lapillus]
MEWSPASYLSSWNGLQPPISPHGMVSSLLSLLMEWSPASYLSSWNALQPPISPHGMVSSLLSLLMEWSPAYYLSSWNGLQPPISPHGMVSSLLSLLMEWSPASYLSSWNGLQPPISHGMVSSLLSLLMECSPASYLSSWNGLQPPISPHGMLSSLLSLLMECVDSDFHPKDIMVAAYASGHLIWSTPLRLRTTCRVDLHAFPFDTQTCTMYFASWVYTGAQLNLTLWGGHPATAFVLKSAMMSKEWTVVSHSIAIRSTWHACCKDPFPDVVVSLSLKRNPLFYMHVFIVPALLVGLLVPFHLLLPPDSCERMTLGSILLASLILLILKLQDVLPTAHSQLPAVGLFYTLSLLWTTLAMVCSILVLNLHSRGPRRGKVPDTIRWIFLRSLKRLVCLGSDTYYPINDMETITMRGLDNPKTSFAINSADRRDQGSTVGDPRAVNARLERELEEVSRQLHVLGARAHLQDTRSDNLNEWRLVALVLDRVLFFVFFVIYLLCAVIVLG